VTENHKKSLKIPKG